jgi:endonuclease III
MPTAINKQRVVDQIFTALKKRYEPAEPEARPVLEQFLYAVCRESASRRQADKAFQSLQKCFYDWNEVRVSSPREIEEALGDIPESAARANRLVSFLQEVFETTYSFDLESLHKKGLKQAAKQLSRYEAASDYVVAWVIQNSLGGHAIPLDDATLSALRTLGLIDCESGSMEDIRGSIEHLIPKAKGNLFVELVTELAHDEGWEDDPRSPMRSFILGDGHEAVTSSASERSVRVKPR